MKLIDACVGQSPASETGAVPRVVAPAEVDGDEPVERKIGRDVEEQFGRSRLEDDEVAGDGGLDKKRPGVVGKDWRDGEPIPERKDPGTTEQPGWRVSA